MIRSLLDAIAFVLEDQGESQNTNWLASQMEEMRLWRASEHDVRAAREKDISEFGEPSQFVNVADEEWALRSWNMKNEAGE